METKMKKVKIITIILAIILVTLVAFGGIYIKTQNRMENKVKEYSLGRELSGGRVIELKVVEKDGVEVDSEYYEIVKKTIEKRLENMKAEDYAISLNKQDGTIIVELAENDNTDTYIYYLTASGKVRIKEKDTETELLNDAMVKKAQYTYTANAEGQYQVYLELLLTKDGQAEIEEIKNNYAIFADEIDEIESAQTDTDEETSTENTANNEENQEETKKIALLTIGETEYDIVKIEKNKVTIDIGGQTSNTTSANNNIAAAAELAMLINSGKYPTEYEIAYNRFVYTDITEKQMMFFAIAVAVIMLVIFVIFTIKYKTKGLLASIGIIGFISILSLLLRYTNVNITIEGIGAIILVLIINFRINQLILDKSTNTVDYVITNIYKEVFLKLIPIIIITVVFCFSGWLNLSSFGMIMFWGLLLIAVYNAIVTKTLLKLKESK